MVCLLDRYICYAYTIFMIKSFSDSETEKVFNQEKSKKLPLEIQKRALVKLLFLESVTSEDDLKNPPSNRFEHLKGKLKDYCSIRINDQWRITFKYVDGEIYEVSIVDYH
jgi:toxin HigB-1